MKLTRPLNHDAPTTSREASRSGSVLVTVIIFVMVLAGLGREMWELIMRERRPSSERLRAVASVGCPVAWEVSAVSSEAHLVAEAAGTAGALDVSEAMPDLVAHSGVGAPVNEGPA